MAVFVKICGLCSADDVAAALAARPDAVGFVFWPRSPRAVTPEEVEPWTREWPAEIARVGVFVGAAPDEAARAADRARLDVLQLHGRESPARYRAIGRRLWAVRRLDDPGAENADDAPDAYVLDSAAGPMPGGTGRTLDWDRATAFVRACARPVILAGGLTPANVAEAVRRVRPWGVDVSSGVEHRPGQKDPRKIEEFIRQCRSV